MATMTVPMSNDKDLYDSSRQILSSLSANKFYAEHLKEEFLQQTADLKTPAKGSTADSEDDKTSHSEVNIAGLNVHIVEGELNTLKDFFTKLKFNYLEQETKEKFLRAILEDPPTWVEPSDKDALDQSNKMAKEELKKSKNALESTRHDLSVAAAQLSDTHMALMQKASKLSQYSRECEEMELELAKLNAETNGEPALTLEEAGKTLDSQTTTLQALAAKLQAAKSEAADAVLDQAALSLAIPALLEKKDAATRLVQEARTNQEAAKLAQKGEGKQALNIEEAVTVQRERLIATSKLLGIRTFERHEDKLTIELLTDNGGIATIDLLFSDTMGTLRGGHCSIGDRDIDIEDALTRAMATGDVPWLIGEIRHCIATDVS